MTRQSAIGALLLSVVVAGCATPSAQETQAASNPATATPSAAASASGMPTPSSTPMPTATSDPTGTPAPVLAFQAPDGFLPPNSIVTVVVDQLQLRTEPGLAASVQGTAVRGERFSVAAYFGPVVRDGIDWYRLWPATVGDLDAWAAAGSGEDRYVEVVAPECPEGQPDLATLSNMTSGWDRLACFGDRPLTIEGTFGCPGGCGGTTGGDFEPFWLAFPFTFNLLWVNAPADPGAGSGLELRFSPDSTLPPAEGSIVRLTGHFSDPASTTCRMSTFDGEQATPVDSRTAELSCRERFVVDAFEVIGTDPDFD